MASAPPLQSHWNSSRGLRGNTKSPAWIVSIALHVLLVIVLGLFLNPPAETVTDEPGRPVGIVLAERSSDRQTEYFRDASSLPEEARTLVAASPRQMLPNPSGDQFLLDPQTDLPALKAGYVSPDNFGLGAASASSLRSTRSTRIFPAQDDRDILAEDPIRNRPAGPHGPPAVIAPFGLEATGHRFVFLIDRSQSMGNRGLGGMVTAAREVARAIARLEPHHQFQIIAYNQRLHFFQPKGLTPALDQNKQHADKFLNSLIASGGTEHDMAIRTGLRRNPDALFLFTDGDEPPLSSGQLRRIVGDNRSQASIHTVLFGSGPLQSDNHFLRRLAQLNRGSFLYLDVRRSDRTP